MALVLAGACTFVKVSTNSADYYARWLGKYYPLNYPI